MHRIIVANRRGHQVVAVTRADGLPEPDDDKLINARADVRDVDALKRALVGADAVVSALGVGPSRAEALNKLGILTAGDLLFHIPHRYEDASTVAPMLEDHAGLPSPALPLVSSSGLSRTGTNSGHSKPSATGFPL